VVSEKQLKSIFKEIYELSNFKIMKSSTLMNFVPKRIKTETNN